MHEMLCVGEIVNSHGIRGELKVVPLVDDISKFLDFKSVTIDNKNYEVQNIRIHKNMVLVKLVGLDDKTNADRLRGKFLEMNRNDLDDLEEGRYYICDIIGLTLIDNTIGEIGKVSDVISTGSNDVYVTKYNDKEICIPALESIIDEININDGYIKINMPKGIID